MAKGKYAVRAAKERAETSGLQADRVAERLTSEREENAAEVAALKAQIQQLSTQLTGAVDDLAGAKVAQAQADAAAQITALRAEHRQTGLEVFSTLAQHLHFDPVRGWQLPAELPLLITALANTLGIPAGQAQQVVADATGHQTNRQTRRASSKQFQEALANGKKGTGPQRVSLTTNKSTSQRELTSQED